MRIKKKPILLFLGAALMVAAVTGYYMYNKPAADILGANGEKVVATNLYATFIKDSTTAKKIFTNKILEVSGIVNRLTKNQQNQPVVLLKTDAEGAAVNCTLEGPATGIKEGDKVSIKGICNGMGEGDADLGIMGDVYLVRCHILR